MAAPDTSYQKYIPYRSDSDSDYESESDESTSSSFSSETGSDSSSSEYAARVAAPNLPPNFRALAGGLSLNTITGTPAENPLSVITPYEKGYPTFKSYELATDPSGVTLKTTAVSVNNIVMLDSRDRDRSVFEQPTSLTLRLPRVYSNVTNFQLVQIKLLSSFLYFRLDKHNTDISILELERTVQNDFGAIVPNIVKNFIRPGTYNIDTLLTELTTQLNRTPVFYDFPNGFQDFAPRFAATGDFSLNFNFPGDTYYDSLLDQFIPNPTMNTIITKYFQQQYAGLSSYTTDQIKIAYYYPVVKEILLDDAFDHILNLTLTTSAQYLLPGETVRSRCIFTFQGLNDQVILEVINNNIPVLEDYRVKHTFRYTLVNKYTASYQANNNHVTIASPSLNTSLVNLLNYKQAQFFAEQLNQNGITEAQYNSFVTQNTVLLAVLNDLFYYIQQWLAVYFAVNFNTYDLNYIASPDQPIAIRNGFQATGISSNYDLAVLERNRPPVSTSILAPLQTSAKPYWNRLTSLPEPTFAFPLNLETGNPSTSSNYPYVTSLGQQDRFHKFVGDDGTLYTNPLTRATDIVVPVEPTKYTVFRFRSPVRQTLQVQTLPRPTAFRYPAYNTVAYDLSAQTLFDNSYAFIENAQNQKMDPAANFANRFLESTPGFTAAMSTSNFGVSYASSLAYWGSSNDYVQVGDTRRFYQLRTPLPPAYSTLAAPGYRYPLSLTIAPPDPASTFTTPMNLYFYHDRGAFMADVSSNRTESPYNYLASVSTTTSMSSATLTFQVYGDQTYYILARSQELAIPTQRFRLAPWFPAGSAFTALTSTLTGFDPLADPQTPAALSNFNYAAVADPAYIRLPIQSSIQTAATQEALFSPLTFSTAHIGYDAAGVSTDLTDYCGFQSGAPNSNGWPGAFLRVDPITGYAFQVDKGYDPASQTYTNPVSGNFILEPNGGGVYTPSTVVARETVLAHWYGTNYIPNSLNQPAMLSNEIAPSNIIRPFSATTTNTPLAGYTYAGSNSAIQFGDGIYGLGLIPGQGLWDIQRVMFKSVYTTGSAATDANRNIAYIGIFPANTTVNKFVHEITLQDATAVLRFSKAVTYTPSTLNIGFDGAEGTYYEFSRDSNWRIGTKSYLNGYDQVRSTINTDINAAYTMIPFDQNGKFLTYQGLVGSPVPYPFYSDASAGLTYFDGTSSPTQQGIVVPRTKLVPDPERGPPAGYDQTQSKYEQSVPIGTNLLQYINPYPFALLSNTMKPFDPLPYAPSHVVADVSGYILTEDSVYRVFQYQADIEDTTLVEHYQFTLDQIYPAAESNVQFIGAAANESEYAFFAYSNLATPTPGTSKLLIRTMSPFTGEVKETYEIANLPGFDPTVQQITNVTYNNFGGFTLALKQGTGSGGLTAICKHTAATSTMTLINNLDTLGFNSNVDRFITRQAPKEDTGKFYIFPYRTGLAGAEPEGLIDYAVATPTTSLVTANPFYKYLATTGEQNTFASSNAPTLLQVFNLSNAASSNPTVYWQPIISRQPFFDYIYMMSPADSNHFYQVVGYTPSNQPYNTSNATLLQSRYAFPVATSNFTQGGNGSKWSLVGNILYGNRNDTQDGPRKVFNAWQLFYPVQRVVMRQVAKNFTNMYDLSGLEYSEYPHMALIGYDASGAITADTSYRWGLERSSNFKVADFSFRGPTFNSFLFTFPLEQSSPAKPYYYLAVRGYSPTEKSQVLMRVSAMNRYDYGYVSMGDLSDEVPLLSTASNAFTPDYWGSLNAFNSNFVIGSNGKIFGANVVQGYAGSNFSNVTGFGDFYGRFVALYNQYNAQVQLVQSINSNVRQEMLNFIQTDLQYILPASSLNRQRFTDPLTFQIQWKSALIPQYARLEENWGLGWNLGYAKADTSYDTVHKADSFYKILDDFINLRLNPEYDMNRMDTSAKEKLSATQEPTGATKAFHAKLLLANFGSFAQTLISNPLSFNPPLGRIDKLSFEWVDVAGAVIDNSDCEWNAVVQIVEKKEVAEIGLPMRLDPTRGAMALPSPLPK